MDSAFLFTLFVILMAYVFDFINGFHDAANSIATIVTTKVLTPRQAVIWAAFFNFIAFLVFNLTVAKTIGSGLIDNDFVDAHFILATLIGAIFWNLVTWYYGLPSSSSHALIGGLAGAAIAKGGFSSLKLTGFLKVLGGIFISPALGLCIALLVTYLFKKLIRNKNKTEFKLFKGFQLCSSALLSLTHGSNDGQKTMGIISILLFSSAWIEGPFYVPFWVVITCQAAISLGTLAGGWRIVRTMGTKITKLDPLKGCAAETGAAISLFIATHCGIPVSTTHTVTGSIAGVGLANGVDGPHWPVIKKIFFSWLITIPAAGIISAALVLSHI
ncbi:inorganic phosphate transporter [Fluoribacter dumoffii]|uniref:Low-affinity inorganic phosphate transporter 1 n=1 Tax=Fluoribacter dumoffii TaxID=463 RepID=A0A377G5E0_9GAMM|nr:inorganic phosphate transporter [Fluoribacter dumoffii]KTC91518.1 inorganic phosphate transporter [Fluoribacter dumoffii NY 23]MCW8387359.1 inorganic phosphate transporter [Fluoribacter dumoffii]MCW8417134.1 inorganic phosphate transporter [Fluoribacter dumoffii]MCW8455026.1 inorganic phosphate transporter [Fluoribacter dumoffii]MCW8460897.1 inorganic phosphate transporter [Fluoribacter dumoffii]